MWQRRFLPDWRGADLLLARLIAALSILTASSYLVGLVGLFSLAPLALVLLASGPIAMKLWPTDRPAFLPEARPPLWLLATLATGLIALVSAWMVVISQTFHTGLAGTDALWYHMPFALKYFQTGSLLNIAYNEPLFQTYFYPSLGSVFHAVGMVFFHRDFLSPLLNLLFLGGGLLAAASIGRRRGVAIPSTLAVASVFAGSGILGGSAGSAMVDTPAAFFFLAAAALLLRDPDSRATIFIAGLAMGLGLGTKLTIAIPAFAFTLGIVWLAPRGSRLRTSGIWIGGISVTGGFWFFRNLLTTGSPLPLLHIPGLPQPIKGAEMSTMVALSHYFTDSQVMLHLLPAAWHARLGGLWFLLVLGGVLGPLLLVIKPPNKAWRVVGLVALSAIVGYFFTPGTAAGQPGGEIKGLMWDTRFIAPGLALGLALLPCSLVGTLGRFRNATSIPLAAILLTTAVSSRWWNLSADRPAALSALPPSVHPSPLTAPSQNWHAITVATLIVLAGFLVWVTYPMLKGAVRWATLLLVSTTLILGGHWMATDYVHARQWGYYSQLPAPGKLKIGIVGTAGVFNQYLMSGTELNNHLVYIGVHGPHGSFRSVTGCQGVRRLINRGNFDFVVVAPDRNIWKQRTMHNSLMGWLSHSSGLKLVRWLPGLPNDYSDKGIGMRDRFALFKITGRQKSWACPGAGKR